MVVNNKYKNIIVSMTKFMASGLLATLIDIALFTFVFSTFMHVYYAELLAGSVGMVVNFILHKRYVFELKRNAYVAFVLYIGFSLIALFFGAWLIEILVEVEWLAVYLIVPKLIVTGVKFFYNYFTKRWVFERRGFK